VDHRFPSRLNQIGLTLYDVVLSLGGELMKGFVEPDGLPTYDYTELDNHIDQTTVVFVKHNTPLTGELNTWNVATRLRGTPDNKYYVVNIIRCARSSR
jgi:hypothetical protein